MDVKLLLPFVEAIANIMPQLGFQSISRNGLRIAQERIKCNGIVVDIELLGMMKGSIFYNIDVVSAESIASKMMMGMPVTELDDMAKSAIGELGNMLAANAAIALESIGVKIDISPPKLISGTSEVSMNHDTKGIIVDMKVDDSAIEVNMFVAQ